MLLTIFPTCSFAFTKTNQEYIEKIQDASVRCHVKRMEYLWEKLCKQDKTVCEEKQDWFNDMLYKTKIRKRENRLYWYNRPIVIYK